MIIIDTTTFLSRMLVVVVLLLILTVTLVRMRLHTNTGVGIRNGGIETNRGVLKGFLLNTLCKTVAKGCARELQSVDGLLEPDEPCEMLSGR